MTKFRALWRYGLFAGLTALVTLVGLVSIGCRATTHSVTPSELGRAASTAEFEALLEVPGPIEVETIVAADWEVERGGILDLSDERAKAAGLRGGPEPIQIYLHAISHPAHGLYLIDTGVEEAMRTAPERAAVRGLVAKLGHIDRMQIHVDTRAWLARKAMPAKGVFLTHLHLDHVTGLRDVDARIPVYTGPGEAHARSAMSLVTRRSIDRALEGRPPIREWQFDREVVEGFQGVIDVFGDGSLWALWMPGHTPGSVAFLARTPKGPVLFAGDVCHTSFGWEHDVPPGTFTMDREANAASLGQLRALTKRHPAIDVRLGHQPRGERGGS